jgi:hypothetical protein
MPARLGGYNDADEKIRGSLGAWWKVEIAVKLSKVISGIV